MAADLFLKPSYLFYELFHLPEILLESYRISLPIDFIGAGAAIRPRRKNLAYCFIHILRGKSSGQKDRDATLKDQLQTILTLTWLVTV